MFDKDFLSLIGATPEVKEGEHLSSFINDTLLGEDEVTLEERIQRHSDLQQYRQSQIPIPEEPVEEIKFKSESYLGDISRLIGSGGLGGIEASAYMLEQADKFRTHLIESGYKKISDKDLDLGDGVGQKIGRWIQEQAGEWDQKLMDQLTPEMQASMQKTFIQEDSWKPGEAWTDLRALTGMLAQSAPATVASLGYGAVVTGALKGIAKGHLKRQAKKAGQKEIGELTERQLKVMAATGYSVGAGVAVGPLSGYEVVEEIRAASYDDLMEIQAFQEAYMSITEDISEAEKLKLAKEKMAASAFFEVAMQAGAAVAVLSAPAGVMFDKLMRGAGLHKKGGIWNFGTYVATEGVTESPQEWSEHVITGYGIQKYVDPTHDPYKGGAEAATAGFVLGTTMAAGTYAGGAAIGAKGKKDRDMESTVRSREMPANVARAYELDSKIGTEGFGKEEKRELDTLLYVYPFLQEQMVSQTNRDAAKQAQKAQVAKQALDTHAAIESQTRQAALAQGASSIEAAIAARETANAETEETVNALIQQEAVESQQAEQVKKQEKDLKEVEASQAEVNKLVGMEVEALQTLKTNLQGLARGAAEQVKDNPAAAARVAELTQQIATIDAVIADRSSSGVPAADLMSDTDSDTAPQRGDKSTNAASPIPTPTQDNKQALDTLKPEERDNVVKRYNKIKSSIPELEAKKKQAEQELNALEEKIDEPTGGAPFPEGGSGVSAEGAMKYVEAKLKLEKASNDLAAAKESIKTYEKNYDMAALKKPATRQEIEQDAGMPIEDSAPDQDAPFDIDELGELVTEDATSGQLSPIPEAQTTPPPDTGMLDVIVERNGTGIPTNKEVGGKTVKGRTVTVNQGDQSTDYVAVKEGKGFSIYSLDGKKVASGSTQAAAIEQLKATIKPPSSPVVAQTEADPTPTMPEESKGSEQAAADEVLPWEDAPDTEASTEPAKELTEEEQYKVLFNQLQEDIESGAVDKYTDEIIAAGQRAKEAQAMLDSKVTGIKEKIAKQQLKVANDKIMDRMKQQGMLAVGDRLGTKSSVNQVTAEVFDAIGMDVAKRWIMSGRLVIKAGEYQAEDGTQIKEGKAVLGAFNTKTGVITLYSDNIPKGVAEQVLRHEIVHRVMASDKYFRKTMMDFFDTFSSLRSKDVAIEFAYTKAADSVADLKENATAEQIEARQLKLHEEAWAYYVQNEKNYTEQPFFKQMLAKVKLWLAKHGIKVGKFNVTDLVELTRASIEKANKVDYKKLEGVPHTEMRATGNTWDTPAFKESLWRGQESEPFFDEAGNLTIYPSYDTLFRGDGVSFAEDSELAIEYGARYSKRPFLLEIDSAYLETLYPLKRTGRTKDVGFRVIGDEREQRVLTSDVFTIPKGKFVIHQVYGEPIDFSNVKTEVLLEKLQRKIVETDFAEHGRSDEGQGYATEGDVYWDSLEKELIKRGITKEEIPYLYLENPVYDVENLISYFIKDDHLYQPTEKEVKDFLAKQEEVYEKIEYKGTWLREDGPPDEIDLAFDQMEKQRNRDLFDFAKESPAAQRLRVAQNALDSFLEYKKTFSPEALAQHEKAGTEASHRKTLAKAKIEAAPDYEGMYGKKLDTKPAPEAAPDTASGTFDWAVKSDNGYEVSSQGDKRFSAFNARLPNNQTIEYAYQVGVKGYKTIKEGKGKPPLNKMSDAQLWQAYLGLWKEWAAANPDLVSELREKAAGKTLTDKFAGKSPNNQARALAEILNEGTITAIEAPAAPKSSVTLPARNQFTPKDQAKSDMANKFIGQGSDASSTEAYRKAWGKLANTGSYSSRDMVFVSVEGKRSGRKDIDTAEIDKATKAGVTFITDDRANRERTYNVGERELAKYLISKGYVDTGGKGIWTKPSIARVTKEYNPNLTPMSQWPTLKDLKSNRTPDLDRQVDNGKAFYSEAYGVYMFTERFTDGRIGSSSTAEGTAMVSVPEALDFYFNKKMESVPTVTGRTMMKMLGFDAETIRTTFPKFTDFLTFVSRHELAHLNYKDKYTGSHIDAAAMELRANILALTPAQRKKLWDTNAIFASTVTDLINKSMGLITSEVKGSKYLDSFTFDDEFVEQRKRKVAQQKALWLDMTRDSRAVAAAAGADIGSEGDAQQEVVRRYVEEIVKQDMAEFHGNLPPKDSMIEDILDVADFNKASEVGGVADPSNKEAAKKRWIADLGLTVEQSTEADKVMTLANKAYLYALSEGWVGPLSFEQLQSAEGVMDFVLTPKEIEAYESLWDLDNEDFFDKIPYLEKLRRAVRETDPFYDLFNDSLIRVIDESREALSQFHKTLLRNPDLARISDEFVPFDEMLKGKKGEKNKRYTFDEVISDEDPKMGNAADAIIQLMYQRIEQVDIRSLIKFVKNNEAPVSQWKTVPESLYKFLEAPPKEEITIAKEVEDVHTDEGVDAFKARLLRFLDGKDAPITKQGKVKGRTPNKLSAGHRRMLERALSDPFTFIEDFKKSLGVRKLDIATMTVETFRAKVVSREAFIKEEFEIKGDVSPFAMEAIFEGIKEGDIILGRYSVLEETRSSENTITYVPSDSDTQQTVYVENKPFWKKSDSVPEYAEALRDRYEEVNNELREIFAEITPKDSHPLIPIRVSRTVFNKITSLKKERTQLKEQYKVSIQYTYFQEQSLLTPIGDQNFKAFASSLRSLAYEGGEYNTKKILDLMLRERIDNLDKKYKGLSKKLGLVANQAFRDLTEAQQYDLIDKMHKASMIFTETMSGKEVFNERAAYGQFYHEIIVSNQHHGDKSETALKEESFYSNLEKIGEALYEQDTSLLKSMFNTRFLSKETTQVKIGEETILEHVTQRPRDTIKPFNYADDVVAFYHRALEDGTLMEAAREAVDGSFYKHPMIAIAEKMTLEDIQKYSKSPDYQEHLKRSLALAEANGLSPEQTNAMLLDAAVYAEYLRQYRDFESLYHETERDSSPDRFDAIAEWEKFYYFPAQILQGRRSFAQMNSIDAAYFKELSSGSLAKEAGLSELELFDIFINKAQSNQAVFLDHVKKVMMQKRQQAMDKVTAAMHERKTEETIDKVVIEVFKNPIKPVRERQSAQKKSDEDSMTKANAIAQEKEYVEAMAKLNHKKELLKVYLKENNIGQIDFAEFIDSMPQHVFVDSTAMYITPEFAAAVSELPFTPDAVGRFRMDYAQEMAENFAGRLNAELVVISDTKIESQYIPAYGNATAKVVFNVQKGANTGTIIAQAAGHEILNALNPAQRKTLQNHLEKYAGDIFQFEAWSKQALPAKNPLTDSKIYDLTKLEDIQANARERMAERVSNIYRTSDVTLDQATNMAHGEILGAMMLHPHFYEEVSKLFQGDLIAGKLANNLIATMNIVQDMYNSSPSPASFSMGHQIMSDRSIDSIINIVGDILGAERSQYTSNNTNRAAAIFFSKQGTGTMQELYGVARQGAAGGKNVAKGIWGSIFNGAKNYRDVMTNIESLLRKIPYMVKASKPKFMFADFMANPADTMLAHYVIHGMTEPMQRVASVIKDKYEKIYEGITPEQFKLWHDRIVRGIEIQEHSGRLWPEQKGALNFDNEADRQTALDMGMTPIMIEAYQWYKEQADSIYERLKVIFPDLGYNPSHYGQSLKYIYDKTGLPMNTDVDAIVFPEASRLEGKRQFLEEKNVLETTDEIAAKYNAQPSTVNPHDLFLNYVHDTAILLNIRKMADQGIMLDRVRIGTDADAGKMLREGFYAIDDKAFNLVQKIPQGDGFKIMKNGTALMDGTSEAVLATSSEALAIIGDTEKIGDFFFDQEGNVFEIIDSTEKAMIYAGHGLYDAKGQEIKVFTNEEQAKLYSKDMADVYVAPKYISSPDKTVVSRFYFKKDLKNELENALSKDNFRHFSIGSFTGAKLLNIKHHTTGVEFVINGFHMWTIGMDMVTSEMAFRQLKAKSKLDYLKSFNLFSVVKGALRDSRDLNVMIDSYFKDPSIMTNESFQNRLKEILKTDKVDLPFLIEQMALVGWFKDGQDPQLRADTFKMGEAKYTDGARAFLDEAGKYTIKGAFDGKSWAGSMGSVAKNMIESVQNVHNKQLSKHDSPLKANLNAARFAVFEMTSNWLMEKTTPRIKTAAMLKELTQSMDKHYELINATRPESSLPQLPDSMKKLVREANSENIDLIRAAFKLKADAHAARRGEFYDENGELKTTGDPVADKQLLKDANEWDKQQNTYEALSKHYDSIAKKKGRPADTILTNDIIDQYKDSILFDNILANHIAHMRYKFIEDRFGEANWKSQHLNKTLASSLIFGWRSFTWWSGIYKSLGKAHIDIGKKIWKKGKGEEHTLTVEGLWLMNAIYAHMSVALLINAIYQVMAGFDDEEVATDTDVSLLSRMLFPRSNTRDTYERKTIPSYITEYSKILHHLGILGDNWEPTKLVSGRFNSIIGNAYEAYNGQDFRGVIVRDKEASPFIQAFQSMAHIAFITPISFSSAYNDYNVKGFRAESLAFSLMGIIQAPAYSMRSDATNYAFSLTRGKHSKGTDKEDQALKDETRRAAYKYMMGDKQPLNDLLKAGTIGRGEYERAIQYLPLIAGKPNPQYVPPLEHAMKRLSVKEAVNTWKLMTPDEQSRMRLRLLTKYHNVRRDRKKSQKDKDEAKELMLGIGFRL